VRDSESRQIAFALSDLAKIAPPAVRPRLEAQSQLFKLIGQQRSVPEAALIYKTLYPLTRSAPREAGKLFGETYSAREFSRDVRLPIRTARTEQISRDEILLTIDGFICGWTCALPELLNAINGAETVKVVLKGCSGGDADIALQLYRALIRRNCSIDIFGFIGSAATVIMLAGNPRRMARTATLSLHGSGTCVAGTAECLRRHADWVDEIEARLQPIFIERTGQSPETVAAWSSDDTLYFEAPEALTAGLVTEIFDAPESPASAAPAPIAEDQDGEPEALARELLPQLRSMFKDPDRFSKILQGVLLCR
jgi:ATP-dependent protease ClpP protease subunit